MSSMPVISYDNMKISLKRIFGGKLESVLPIEIKSEPVFFNEEPRLANYDAKYDNYVKNGIDSSKEVYFGQNRVGGNKFRGNSGKFRGYGQGRPRRYFSSARRGSNFVSGNYRGTGNRQLNPPGPDGEPSKYH